MQQVKKYVIALVSLYGLVHRDTVIEIYNQQNEDNIDSSHIRQLLENEKRKLFYIEHVGTYQEYFVKRKIIEQGNIEQELEFRELLPTYVPTVEEIECYGVSPYVEPTYEYGHLVNFLSRKYWYSYRKCVKQAFNILLFCRSARDFEGIHDHLYNSPLKFKDEEEMLELAGLIVDLAYVTRVQEFNGYTPSELLDKRGKFPKKLRQAIKKEFPVYAEMLGILTEKELAEAGEELKKKGLLD